MTRKAKLVTLGRLGASYGVRGWMKVNSFTEHPQNIFNYQTWLLEINGKLTEVNVEDFKVKPNALTVKLNISNSMEEAKLYNNLNVYVKDSDLPDLEDDEVYWKDLFGCQVYNKEGYHLGTIKQIMETGSNDVLLLNAPLNDQYKLKERLIPYVEDYVLEVDIANKKIVVDWDPEF